jgi:hypothetical protein
MENVKKLVELATLYEFDSVTLKNDGSPYMNALLELAKYANDAESILYIMNDFQAQARFRIKYGDR